MSSSQRKMHLEIQIPDENHMLLPLIDFNWHFQSVVSPTASTPDSHWKGKSPAPDLEDESRDEFFRVFKAFDENDDGLISKQEVSRLMSKLGHEMSDSDLELLMLTVDRNGDGCVDFDEFHSLYTKLENHHHKYMYSDDASEEEEEEDAEADEEENLMDAFKVFDRNDDGFITPEELHTVLSKLGFVQGSSGIAACRRMIRGVDSNGDGLVDFSEFKHMMQSRPSPRAYFASMIEAA